MGWYISLRNNTIEFSEECAKELFALYDCPWDDFKELKIDNFRYKLGFSRWHKEHMDYLCHRDDILDILLKYKVNGYVEFASLDGDNAGDNWTYHFKDGVMNQTLRII